MNVDSETTNGIARLGVGIRRLWARNSIVELFGKGVFTGRCHGVGEQTLVEGRFGAWSDTK